MTLNVGTVLNNRYRIVKLAGQGGFGAVYRAWDMSLTQPVALKENIDTGVESQRQFEREARLLAGLRHPNLPVVIDHFILPGQGQYLVMDFVEGKSLRDLLAERGGPLGEAEALPWIRQVAGALEYLHTRTPPVIHRDIKPDNIIVTADGRAILVDFGISKAYVAGAATTVGARAVTPGYSPPEQYGRGRTDARSDVYALGATLYTLLTGLVPPDGPDLSSGADTLIPPRQANPAVSEATSSAVVAAMAPTISQRLASAAGFGQRLATGAGTLPPAAPVAPLATTTPMPAPPGASSGAARRRGVPVLGWLVGVAAIIALAVWAGATFGGGGGGVEETTPEATEALVVVATPRATATAEPTAIARATETDTSTPRPSPTHTPTITPTQEPQAGDIRVVNRGEIEVEQVFVPAGSFIMGSDEGEEDERPAHEVMLDAFWLDRTEVTNAQYAACVADGPCAPPEDTSSYTRDNYYDNPEYADYPVIYVSWDDAAAYAAWAGGRLPTEAEWEYAARGPESFVYPWGNQAITCDLANYWGKDGGCVGDTSIVGAYPNGTSWVGALDMAGNVWEWVNDWFDGAYYRNSPSLNPPGPDSGEAKALRGGAWNNDDRYSRAAFRHYFNPHFWDYDVGFRVVELLSDPGS